MFLCSAIIVSELRAQLFMYVRPLYTQSADLVVEPMTSEEYVQDCKKLMC